MSTPKTLTRCPSCGRLTQSSLGKIGGRKGALSRWARFNSEQRSAEMSRRRQKGIKKKSPKVSTDP